ncbi:MAG: SRPBCC family protein [Phenylobacterium sp.]
MSTDLPPPPDIELGAPMIAHTERVVIDMPPDAFSEWMLQARLEDQIPDTGALPGVVGTAQLTPGDWGRPGARRVVHLSDGARCTEQVLSYIPGQVFRYVVWDYTTAAARRVTYAVGEFLFAPLEGGRTEVTWTYAFRLKPDRFPGKMGRLGRWIFRHVFLERNYAELMRATLQATKAYAEGKT